MLPFQFPSMPALPMPAMSMPAMPTTSMDPFDMRMPGATDMMAQMQMDMSQSMASMQMQSIQQMESMQSSCMQQVEQMQMQQMSQMQQSSQQSIQQSSQQSSQQSIQQSSQQSSQQSFQQSSQQSFQQSSQQSFQQQHQELQNFQLNEPGHEQTVEVSELDDQDFFVPLRHIEKVQKNALSEATAMAKMRDGIFELVINIQGFEPEDVQIFCVDQEQAVYVKAKHVTEEGFVNNVYEQKFSLPDDVDTQKLTSGMSRDGILMIRVPRALSPERIIPIKREVKMEAVKKALKDCIQYSVEMNETSVEQIHAELEEANIVPLNVEKPEDAVKAASAEVVESQTIGVAEAAGAEAGEAAGLSAGVPHCHELGLQPGQWSCG